MEFLKQNYIYIFVLSILIFASLVIFSIFKDKFKDVPPFLNKKIKKDINIESFSDNNISMPEAFCKKYRPKPHLLKSHCKNLGNRGCHIPSCCVLLDNTECVPGDHTGPTFRTQNNEPINANFYHHQGKCRSLGGKCPIN